MDKIAGELIKLAKALTGGPVRGAIWKDWNVLHDIENGLDEAMSRYDIAASYGESGSREAKELIRKLSKAKKELERLSMKTFSDLSNAERSFEKKFGDVDDYIEAARNKMFSK